MSSNEEILSFDIVIDTKLSDNTKKAIEDLQNAQEEKSDTTSQEDAESLLEAEESLEKIKPDLVEALNSMDSSDIKQFAKFARNPTEAAGGAVQDILSRLLGSRATAIMGPLAIAIAAPIVMMEFIKAMSVKGGPLNRDWRRFIQEEVEVGLSRVQQKEKELGISQTILTQVKGFAPNNENWTYNSLFDVNDSRIARIGLSDREAGVTMFLG